MANYIVTIGDSVHWGQGLTTPHKLHTIVAREVRKTTPDLIEHFMAHSGAVIGVGLTVTNQRVDGEVPVPSPTILEQAAGFPGDPADVLAVLVNGGINDITIQNILNPFVSTQQLADLTKEHCLDSMEVLLDELAQRFPAATTKIIVTGYYPILSYRSNPVAIHMLQQFHGIFVPPAFEVTFTAAHNPVVDHCLQFWKQSRTHLQDAVTQAAAAYPGRIFQYVDPGFTERNAVFADDPLLFGLTIPTFLPNDEVVHPRHTACNGVFDPIDFLAREGCYRASAGHPNVAGAKRYADAILAVI